MNNPALRQNAIRLIAKFVLYLLNTYGEQIESALDLEIEKLLSATDKEAVKLAK